MYHHFYAKQCFISAYYLRDVLCALMVQDGPMVCIEGMWVKISIDLLFRALIVIVIPAKLVEFGNSPHAQISYNRRIGD